MSSTYNFKTSIENVGILNKSNLNPNAAVFQPRGITKLASVDNTVQHHSRDVGSSTPSLESAISTQKVDKHTKLSKKTALPIVPYTIVYSTTNQRSFLGEYGGAQCTSMSLAAIARWSLVGTKTTTEGITDIVYEGHQLHVMLREDFKLSTNPDRRVGLEDLPEQLQVSLFNKNVRFTREGNSLCFTSHTEDRNFLPTITDFIKLHEHHSGNQLFVITIKSWSQAVCQTAGGAILLFDSHGNITHGNTKLEGLAAVLQFGELAQLGSFLVEWRGAGASAHIQKYAVDEEIIDVGFKQNVSEHIHEGHIEALTKGEEVQIENIADVLVNEVIDGQSKEGSKDGSISNKILGVVKEEVVKVVVEEVLEKEEVKEEVVKEEVVDEALAIIEVEVAVEITNEIAYGEDEEDPYVCLMGGFGRD